MTSSIADRESLWTKFLERWPLHKLTAMTLADYTQAGTDDYFCLWVERLTEELGSIRGGSSLKFGIYSRSANATKEPSGQTGVLQDSAYGWYTKYGATADEAFATVKALVVQVAQAARDGRVDEVEQIDLWPIYKRKLAFLYQDRKRPCILPIYLSPLLKAAFGQGAPTKVSDLYKGLLSLRGDEPLLAYADRLYAKAKEAEHAAGSQNNVTVILTQGAIDNGYIRLPKNQTILPEYYASQGDQPPSQTFQLSLPDGNTTDTWLLGQYGRIRARFGALFAAEKLVAGDRAIITQVADHQYRLTFDRQSDDTPELPDETPSMEPPKTMKPEPLNQILYGPPGTGKTYATIDAALAILDPAFVKEHANDRPALKRQFDQLSESGRVRFVTFHQSFSYEDFVEGIRAHTTTDDGRPSNGVQYRIEKGVFAELCQDARRNKQLESSLGIREGARVWKVSIEETSSGGETRAYCLKHNEARLGWPNAGDLNTANLSDPELGLGSKEQSSLDNFGQQIAIGDVVLCLASKTSISAVGVVTGEYQYTPQVPNGVRDDYVHMLPVHWLVTGIKFDILALNKDVQLTLQAVYPLSRITWPALLDALTAANITLSEIPKAQAPQNEPYVLVIDEINRGNVSRIFGELITLIEPSKRAGASEALETTLPYSKDRFSVPGNVYVIGTMNTADRSLAGLDVALRRRFVFKEMPPKPELLDEVDIDGINVGALLRAMNQRIEVLLDRDHALGHAYFMHLKHDASLPRLADIFRNQVLPLLQEYFFDDWQRIQWVFNDQRKPSADYQFVQALNMDTNALFGEGVTVSQHRSGWRVNGDAFDLAESYLGVINHLHAA